MEEQPNEKKLAEAKRSTETDMPMMYHDAKGRGVVWWKLAEDKLAAAKPAGAA